MSSITSLKSIGNKNNVNRGKESMFCKSFREHEMDIIDFEKKK